MSPRTKVEGENANIQRKVFTCINLLIMSRRSGLKTHALSTAVPDGEDEEEDSIAIDARFLPGCQPLLK